MRSAILISVVALGVGACKKADKSEPAKPAAVTTPAADGSRRVAIEAGQSGYVPDKISGKPGEKLTLVFTRTVDGECLAQVKTPDGKLIALPKGTAVEVPVTVPTAGEVKFACGMDMFTGVVVAEKT